MPDELRLDNGQSPYRAPGSELYATPEHVHSERVLVEAAAQAGARGAAARAARSGSSTELAESGIELGADQAAAVRGVLTSGARIESLVGPAGTGKSFVVGALAKAWQDPGLWGGAERRVFGLAASQIATDVLTGEGLRASNITRWLAAQERDDAAWRLRPGDLVVVDESAMAATADLAAVHRHVEAAGAKLLLVGDHRQLAAVGAGGGMELLANAGASYELAEARRFEHEWEREASLRLRAADETVLGEYHKHGRLLDAGTADQAEASAARAWLADTLSGTARAARRRHQRAGRPAVRVAARRAGPARPGRRGRRAARPAGHVRRGRRRRAGPAQRLEPRRLRGQPPRADQPRDLPRARHPRRRRSRRGAGRRRVG